MTRDLRHPITAERDDRSQRYLDLRRRLRLTTLEVAAATGYSLGYACRWDHAGQSAVPVPASAVTRLEELLLERALSDLEHLGAAGIREVVRLAN